MNKSYDKTSFKSIFIPLARYLQTDTIASTVKIKITSHPFKFGRLVIWMN